MGARARATQIHFPARYPFGMTRTLRILLIALLLGLLAACASEPVDQTAGMSAEAIYKEARSNIDSGNWDSAIDLLEKLEARYPYGVYAEQAQLDLAYAHYKNHEPDSAIVAADRFIKLHPRHEHVDYAYYLRGLASFDSGRSFLQRLFDQDVAERDPQRLTESFNYFKELSTRFPDSRYAADAAKRMVYVRELLARHELKVADYYLRRGAPLAAVNRAKYLIDTFPRTPVQADALAVMVRGYRALELPKLADDALRVLALNFPRYAGLAELQGGRAAPAAAEGGDS